MHRPPRALVPVALLFAALASLPAAAAVSLPTGFVDETIVGGLDLPNSMAFLPDGRLLFTEQRSGHVRMVVNGHVAASDPVLNIGDVNVTGLERGLQGIAIDPQWPARPYVYLYYTREGEVCALVRYRASGDLDDPSGETLALSGGLDLIDDIPDHAEQHQAGCLRFDASGDLFVSLGEDEDVCAAYDSTTLKGELLRVRVRDVPDGSGFTVPRALLTPPDNPLSTSDSNARLVWAYGMRNPWRYHVDPVSGLVYLADVGEQDFEEYNEVAAGDYLGWPYREGLRIMPRDGCPEPGGEGSVAFTPPIVIFAHADRLCAIVSAGIYRPVPGAASNWPSSYWGDVFWGDYYGGFLRRMKKTDGVWAPALGAPGQPTSDDWATGLESNSDFLVGPDGSLWWLRQIDAFGTEVSGSLHRIRATDPAEPLPVAFTVRGFRGRQEGVGPLLEFTTPTSGEVRLELFDVSGRRVLDRDLGFRPAGEQSVLVAGLDLPSAVYVARLRQGGRTASGKAILIR